MAGAEAGTWSAAWGAGAGRVRRGRGAPWWRRSCAGHRTRTGGGWDEQSLRRREARRASRPAVAADDRAARQSKRPDARAPMVLGGWAAHHPHSSPLNRSTTSRLMYSLQQPVVPALTGRLRKAARRQGGALVMNKIEGPAAVRAERRGGRDHRAIEVRKSDAEIRRTSPPKATAREAESQVKKPCRWEGAGMRVRGICFAEKLVRLRMLHCQYSGTSAGHSTTRSHTFAGEPSCLEPATTTGGDCGELSRSTCASAARGAAPVGSRAPRMLRRVRMKTFPEKIWR